MFDNGRKNICVILCDVADHYQEQLCRTLTTCARVKGYNLAYFSFFLCYGVDTKNGRGEANIINLVPYEEFDGFIICHDTFQNKAAVESIFRYIKERAKGPVVLVRRGREDYHCVVPDSIGAIKGLVQHFVSVHGFKRIAFMSGPKDHPDAQIRLQDYRDGLESCGLSYDEDMVFYGNFWKERSKEAARYFTMSLPECPEAIICANDYMAISLCNELINIGTMVPEDIAISGFDDIWEATINIPPMTTVAMPVQEMAERAFVTLTKLMDGEQVPKVQKIKTDVAIRNSCGCEGMDMSTMLRKRVRQTQEHERLIDLVQNNTYMSVELSDINYAEEMVEHLHVLEDEDNFIRNFFICLGEGHGNSYPKYMSKKSGYPKKMKSVGSVMNRQIIETKVFETKDLIPKEATEQEPMIYYFFPIHTLEVTFGYFAISYQGVHSCERTFHSWIAIIGNSLENLYLKRKNQSLLEELNNLYIHDALTGLENRRGFENGSLDMYLRSRKQNQSMIIISIDMDNLKVVNDCFGHVQGDVALQAIGRAIEKAARKEDVCCRAGGDEFSVIGLDYTKEDAEKFLQTFQESLSAFNEDSNLPYLVGASCGYYIISKDSDITLEAAIVESDNKLYENKRAKKAAQKDYVMRDEK